MNAAELAMAIKEKFGLTKYDIECIESAQFKEMINEKGISNLIYRGSINSPDEFPEVSSIEDIYSIKENDTVNLYAKKDNRTLYRIISDTLLFI